MTDELRRSVPVTEPVERMEVDVVNLEVCESGHITQWVPTHAKAWVFRHKCGGWAWEDGNYCPRCGVKL